MVLSIHRNLGLSEDINLSLWERSTHVHESFVEKFAYARSQDVLKIPTSPTRGYAATRGTRKINDQEKVLEEQLLELN